MVKHVTPPPEGDSLGDLADEGDAQDAAAARPAPGVEVTVMDGAGPPGNAQILAGALAAGREVFCNFTKLESPRRLLDDSRVKELAGVWVPVLDKHGVDLARFMGDYGAEVAAIIATFTIAHELRQAVRAEIAEREAKAKAAATAGVDDGSQD